MPQTTGEGAVVPHDALVALLTALPFGFAALFMLLNARHSAATGSIDIYLGFSPTLQVAVKWKNWNEAMLRIDAAEHRLL